MRFDAPLLPFVGFALVIGIWWLSAASGVVGDHSRAHPAAVLDATWTGLRTTDGLLVDIRLSVLRVVIGVVVGCALSLPAGFLLAWFPTLRAMFDPIVNFCRALPPISLSRW